MNMVCCCCRGDDGLVEAEALPSSTRVAVVAPDKSHVEPAQLHAALSRGSLLTMRVAGKGGSEYVCTTLDVGDAIARRIEQWKQTHGLHARSQATAGSANSFLEVKAWRRSLGALRAVQEQHYLSMLRALRTRHPDESVVALLRLHDYPADPWTPPKQGDLCIVWAPKMESGGLTMADRTTTNPYTVSGLLLWASMNGASAQWVLRREASDISCQELHLDHVHRKLFHVGLISRLTSSWSTSSRTSLGSTLSSHPDGLFSRLRGNSNLVQALAFSSRRSIPPRELHVHPASITSVGLCSAAAAPQTRRLLSPHALVDGTGASQRDPPPPRGTLGQWLSTGTVDVAELCLAAGCSSPSSPDAPEHALPACVFCEACGEPDKLCFCAAGKARRKLKAGGGLGTVPELAPPPATAAPPTALPPAIAAPPTVAGASALERARRHNRVKVKEAWLPRQVWRASRVRNSKRVN